MAYNGFFPNYGANNMYNPNNPYYQTMQRMGNMYPDPNYNNMNQSQQMTAGQDIPFVDGYEGAKMYPIPAGKQFVLMDSKEPKFYVKMLNNQGYPMINVFDFKPAEPTQSNNMIESTSNIKTEDFVSRNDFDDLLKKYETLQNDYIQFKTVVTQVANQLPMLQQVQQPQQSTPVATTQVVPDTPENTSSEKVLNEKGAKK